MFDYIWSILIKITMVVYEMYLRNHIVLLYLHIFSSTCESTDLDKKKIQKYSLTETVLFSLLLKNTCQHKLIPLIVIFLARILCLFSARIIGRQVLPHRFVLKRPISIRFVNRIIVSPESGTGPSLQGLALWGAAKYQTVKHASAKIYKPTITKSLDLLTNNTNASAGTKHKTKSLCEEINKLETLFLIIFIKKSQTVQKRTDLKIVV